MERMLHEPPRVQFRVCGDKIFLRAIDRDTEIECWLRRDISGAAG